MTTSKQMQEALQQQQHELQVLGARMAALETQLLSKECGVSFAVILI